MSGVQPKGAKIPNGPRERLMRCGVGQLSDSDLLAILLRVGIQDCGVLELSQKLIDHFGSLYNLTRATPQELMNALPGIGQQKACTLVAAFEIGSRALKPAEGEVFSPQRWKESQALALASESRELIVAAMVDSRGKFVCEDRLSWGGVNGAMLDVPHLLRLMVRRSCAGLYIGHNHPNGDLRPSRDDLIFTKRVSEKLACLGMQMIEHVVFAGGRWVAVEE